jgi:hypothetical protein
MSNLDSSEALSTMRRRRSAPLLYAKWHTAPQADQHLFPSHLLDGANDPVEKSSLGSSQSNSVSLWPRAFKLSFHPLTWFNQPY